MTREEILNMPASAEMDVMIAEQVLGWKRDFGRWVDRDGNKFWTIEPDEDYYACENQCTHFTPSTEIAPAWEVVEKLGLSVLKVQDGWQARKHVSMSDETSSNGETAPLAICRAALLALNQPEEANDRR
jgi:hypothetical protein